MRIIRSFNPAPHGGPGLRGFTLIELLLVTVVLGIVATIVSPYFARARERAILAQMEADARQLMDGIEFFSNLNDGRWPISLAEVVAEGSYVPSGEVEYCLFLAVPPGPTTGPYVLAIAGHPSTTAKILISYPRWGSRMLDFDNGQRGC